MRLGLARMSASCVGSNSPLIVTLRPPLMGPLHDEVSQASVSFPLVSSLKGKHKHIWMTTSISPKMWISFLCFNASVFLKRKGCKLVSEDFSLCSSMTHWQVSFRQSLPNNGWPALLRQLSCNGPSKPSLGVASKARDDNMFIGQLVCFLDKAAHQDWQTILSCRSESREEFERVRVQNFTSISVVSRYFYKLYFNSMQYFP